MITKVKLVFDRKGKAGTKGEGEIEIYIYHQGKKRYLSTGVSVRRREYSNGIVSVRADAVELNKRIQLCVREVQSQINEMIDSDCVDISKLCLRDVVAPIDFYEWANEWLSTQEISNATVKGYRIALLHLSRSGVVSNFADITLTNVEKYEEHMKLNNLNANTRSIMHVKINRLARQLVKEGKLKENPYKHFRCAKVKEADVKYLREDERVLLEKAKVKSEKLEKARCLFLLSCYTGMRWSDIAQLDRGNAYKQKNQLWIKGRTQKTGSVYDIPLLPQAVAILDKYDWNFREDYTTARARLLKLCDELKLPRRLTYHMARHTFATWALSNGVRIEVVSKILTHTDITTTQIYAKVLQKDVEAGFNILAKAGANVG